MRSNPKRVDPTRAFFAAAIGGLAGASVQYYMGGWIWTLVAFCVAALIGWVGYCPLSFVAGIRYAWKKTAREISETSGLVSSTVAEIFAIPTWIWMNLASDMLVILSGTSTAFLWVLAANYMVWNGLLYAATLEYYQLVLLVWLLVGAVLTAILTGGQFLRGVERARSLSDRALKGLKSNAEKETEQSWEAALQASLPVASYWLLYGISFLLVEFLATKLPQGILFVWSFLGTLWKVTTSNGRIISALGAVLGLVVAMAMGYGPLVGLVGGPIGFGMCFTRRFFETSARNSFGRRLTLALKRA